MKKIIFREDDNENINVTKGILFDIKTTEKECFNLFMAGTDEMMDVGDVFCVRTSGNLKGRAFHLPEFGIKWEIVEDDEGEQVLLPIRD